MKDIMVGQWVSSNARWSGWWMFLTYHEPSIILKTSVFNIMLDSDNNYIETCAFYCDGTSSVLGRFDDMKKALDFHMKLCKTSKLDKPKWRQK